MTRTEELLALAEAATPGPWKFSTDNGDNSKIEHAGEGFAVLAGCGCCGSPWMELKDGDFVAAANPETIKQLVELCRLQHEALKMLDYGTRFDEATEAIAAFNRFEQGEE